MYGIIGGVVVIIIGLVIYGSIIGFDNLKDKIFGNDMCELVEVRWYWSEYGNFVVIIEMLEVFKCVGDSVLF